MKEDYSEVVRKYKGRPLTFEEERELCVNSIKRIGPFLREFERAHIESLSEAIRKGVTCYAA